MAQPSQLTGVWPSPAEAWRTRFVGPHRCKHGLWWVWDRLTQRGVGPYRTRQEARDDVRRTR